MKVLSTSPRKCTVTGIDNQEIPELDLVQCGALVDSNHRIVNLIMNEYAYYSRGHSIHSSGQIECYTNTVDDKSVPTKYCYHCWIFNAIVYKVD